MMVASVRGDAFVSLALPSKLTLSSRTARNARRTGRVDSPISIIKYFQFLPVQAPECGEWNCECMVWVCVYVCAERTA